VQTKRVRLTVITASTDAEVTVPRPELVAGRVKKRGPQNQAAQTMTPNLEQKTGKCGKVTRWHASCVRHIRVLTEPETLAWKAGNLNEFQIHTRLADAVKAAAYIRNEIARGQCTLLGKLSRQLRLLYLNSCIDGLTWQLRRGY
jgi:ribosomal 50S subunit-associated protein YjgA (DUF615 family)